MIDCLITDHSPAVIILFCLTVISLYYCPYSIIILIFISFNAIFISFITVSTTIIFTTIYH